MAAATVASSSSTGAAAAAASTEGEHVLTTPWVLWEERDNADKGPDEKWGDLLIPVGEFSTVEQFWRLWTHVPKLT